MYRTVFSATNGEQIKVERQFNAGNPSDRWAAWVTVDKYMTANLAKLPKQTRPWMRAMEPPAPAVEEVLVESIPQIKWDYNHNETKLVVSPTQESLDPDAVLPRLY